MKKKHVFYLLLVVGVVAILLSYYYEGKATERFGKKYNEHLDSFKDALVNAIPCQVGSWQANPQDDKIGIPNKDVARVAGAEGAIGRQYNGTSELPSVFINITCGPCRSVGAHTPDVCFTGSGNEQETPVEFFRVDYKVTIPDPADPRKKIQEDRTAVFKTATFSDNDSHFVQRVFWSWKGAGTNWLAPMFPRLQWYPNEPVCKMYVSIMEDPKKDTLKIAEDFLKVFLPELDPVLTGSYVVPPEMRIIRGKDESAEKELVKAVSRAQDGVPEKEDDYSLSVPTAIQPGQDEPLKLEIEAKPKEEADSSEDGTSEEKTDGTLPAENSEDDIYKL